MRVERKPVRFLVDLMLMRLGRWLRLMGQDVANPEGISDDALLGQARNENRTIITRDKGLFLACREAGVPCVLVRSSNISDQLLEMAREGVPLQLDPKRCTLCNGPLMEIEISLEIAAQMKTQPKRLWRCVECQKLYWEGSHWKKIKMTLGDIAPAKI